MLSHLHNAPGNSSPDGETEEKECQRLTQHLSLSQSDMQVRRETPES